MVARLWWKDIRQFWPIWLLVAAAALAMQVLALHYGYVEARQGGMAVAAFLWTGLYGFAVAAAAFAGERETRTLDLLDALPVERWRLWMAKSSFAVASTLALGLVLFLAASLVTDRWQIISPGRGVLMGALVLLMVLGWGLLWSAVTSNALLAAVLAITSALLVIPAADNAWNLRLFNQENANPLNLAIAVLALLGSALVFIRSGPPRRPLVKRGFRSAATQAEAAAASIGTVRPGRPWFWPAAMWSLAWQAGRDLRSIGGWVILLAVAIPLFGYLRLRPLQEPVAVVCTFSALILAGISVFGTDNRARTQAFLTNHGVAPHLVWLVKVGTWLAALAVLATLVSLVHLATGFLLPRGAVKEFQALLLVFGFLAIGFAVAVLCGMTIRRGITAGLVALVFWIVLAFPLGWMSALELMPSGFLWLLPLTLLAVSFFWSPDWMLDRPGARRWVWLGLLLAGSFAVLFIGYIAYRAASVPTLAPERDAELFTFSTPTTVPESENAAALLRQAVPGNPGIPPAANRWGEMMRVIENGWDPKAEKALIDWHKGSIHERELIREASRRPYARFVPIEGQTAFTPSRDTLPSLFNATGLMALSVRELEFNGDLDGAWNDLMVMFRLSRQWTGAVPMEQAFSSLANESMALSLAMSWAVDSRQTAPQLRKALDAYRTLPALPSAADPIRVEARIMQNTEQLPRSAIAEQILESRAESNSEVRTADKLWADLVTTPWELARTRKAFRLLYGSRIEQALVEPWYASRARYGIEGAKLRTTSGPEPTIIAPAELETVFATTPLVALKSPLLGSYLEQWDRTELGRRALVQILALRVWQLEHGGRLPERLQELVRPGLLDALPTDPYTPKHPFSYVRASGQSLLPLGRFGPFRPGAEPLKQLRPTIDSWLLYSIGPDLRDDSASRNDQERNGGDIIFPLSESPKASTSQIK